MRLQFLCVLILAWSSLGCRQAEAPFTNSKKKAVIPGKIDSANNKLKSFEIPKEVERQKEEIIQEIATLGQHDWAGTYRTWNWKYSFRTLWLAPKSGAVAVFSTCTYRTGQKYDSVTLNNDKINIQRELDAKNSSEDFLLVRWDERRYLIHPEDALKFCNMIISKNEAPDESMSDVYREWAYFLREGDGKKPARGQPVFPKGFEKYQRYVAIGSIRATILTLGPESKKVIGEAPREQITRNVTIDAGSAEGVFPDMRFQPVETSNAVQITVTKVSEHEASAIATYTRTGGEKEPFLAIGLKLSAHPPVP